MIYAHAWPIEDDSFTGTQLVTEAIEDLDDNVLPALGVTRTTFPTFDVRHGWLIARTDVTHPERSAA